jgi:hypothetical protein
MGNKTYERCGVASIVPTAMVQLAARKNVIQMSSDVINYNSNCHSGLSRHLPPTGLDYFVFPYLKNNVFKNRPGTIPELMHVN